MKRQKRSLWALALASLMMLAAGRASAAERKYYGNMMVDHCREWVSLRDGPGTDCARLAKVPLFDIVTDAEWTPICGDFIYCNYNDQYGYILAKYLEPWADPEPEDDEDGLPVRIDWAKAAAGALVIDGDGEYVAVTTEEAVTGFALLSLDELTTDEQGDFTFRTSVMLTRDALAAGETLVLQIAFPGDFPSYGIQFTDSRGQAHRYAIGMSGRDGSLLLEEF